jgi:NADH dehydrogenase
MTLSGRFAWLLWVFADIYFLIGFRSRIVVALDWLWAYVTFRRGARIVLAETGGAGWRSRGQCPDACNGRRGDQIMSMTSAICSDRARDFTHPPQRVDFR